jgi:hypothetical protein
MNYFQSIGIVFSLIVLIILTIATMYLSYILAIGILIVGLVYVVKQLLDLTKSGNKLN